jgi:hypothetical protein
MYRNMLFFTLLFIETGWPSSYSIPASPPSPATPCIFSCSSLSSSAWVFFLGLISSVGLATDFCRW